MTASDPNDFPDLLATAHALADLAGLVTLPHFRSRTPVDHKGGRAFDPVTAADRDAEAAVRQALAERYPDHGIVGEEQGDHRADAAYCWIIDPIDGTRAFIMGQPLWGTLIGLTVHGTPLLGMMDQPYTGERFWSDTQASFFRRGGETETLHTRPCPSLPTAILAATGPDMFEGADARAFAALSGDVRLTRFGGDCYNYCLLAMGYIDLVVEAKLKPFDIVPLIPIVERAGGVVSTWDGGDPSNGGRILAAGDPALHQAAMDALSS